MHATIGKAQIKITRSSAVYWRVTFDNPPLKRHGPAVRSRVSKDYHRR